MTLGWLFVVIVMTSMVWRLVLGLDPGNGGLGFVQKERHTCDTYNPASCR